MKILNYYIPKDKQSDRFIMSFKAQIDSGKNLSRRQIEVLEDNLEIELDFFNHHFVPLNKYKSIWDQILEKVNKNRFVKIKNKNRCIRALHSIMDGRPDNKNIDIILDRNNRWKK